MTKLNTPPYFCFEMESLSHVFIYLFYFRGFCLGTRSYPFFQIVFCLFNVNTAFTRYTFWTLDSLIFTLMPYIFEVFLATSDFFVDL